MQRAARPDGFGDPLGSPGAQKQDLTNRAVVVKVENGFDVRPSGAQHRDDSDQLPATPSVSSG